MKKVMILLCVLTLGVLFQSFTDKKTIKTVDTVFESQLEQLQILLTPTKVFTRTYKSVKMVKLFAGGYTTVCTSQNTLLNESYTVLYRAGVDGASPSIKLRTSHGDGTVTWDDIDVVSAIRACAAE